MRKLIILILALMCVFGMAGCNASHPVAHVGQIDDTVKDLTIVHSVGGTLTEWQVDGEALKGLRDWSVKRSYQAVDFEDGQTPGDSNGNESYHFFMPGDTLPDFSYIISGEDKHYLLVEGNWYSVSNPAIPPVTEPADIVSFLAKVLEVKDNYLLVVPLADSNESKSADKIEVPLAGKTSWPVPAVGDTVNIFYSGGIQETYPARITKVHRVEIETAS